VSRLPRTRLVALSWDDVWRHACELSEAVLSSGFEPDMIVGVARGGWIVAVVLSDLLGVSEVASLRVRHYLGVARPGERAVVEQGVSADVRGKRVLLADDVADTGETLRAAVGHLTSLGASEVRTAVLHVKPWCRVRPNYYARVYDCWIVYPWSVAEVVRSLSSEEGPERALRSLEEAGVRRGVLSLASRFALRGGR